MNRFPQGCSQRILGFARNKRVEPPGTHDIPRRHLATVLVALVSVRLVAVHGFQNVTNTGVTLFGVLRSRVEPGDVVAGFVAMRILANQAGDIGLVAAYSFGRRLKKGV